MKYTTFLKTLLLAPALLLTASVAAAGGLEITKGMLENPKDNSLQSGIGIFYGWHCDADKIEILIDDKAAKTVAYGMPRKDTLDACGDTDNGFGFVYAFNLLDAEELHTVKALADGIEFASAQFTVDYLDPGYIRGLASYAEITVPALGKEAILVWQENMQGYVVSNVQDLDFTIEDIIAAAVGNWSGTWESAWAPGSTMNMAVGVVQIPGGVTFQPTSITINGTGCAVEAETATPITSFDSMISHIVMKDGSEVEIEFLAAESMTAVAGTLLFDSGPCEGLDGVYTLFKQAQ